MPDHDLLRAFVSVVDAGGFTRAGARVHRTQSTVSQQIRRLEDQLGRRLLLRDGKGVRTTAEGEVLLGYARRILSLNAEAEAALAAAPPARIVRLGIPDDFAVAALTEVISRFALARPDVRLAVQCALSADLLAGLARGEFDLVLAKREPMSGPAHRVWRERLVWVAGAAVEPRADVVPLVAFRQGCLYRARAVHALEQAGRPWRIAYESSALLGIKAALEGGLGVAVLTRRAIDAGQRILTDTRLWPDIAPTELALCVSADLTGAAGDLVDLICAFCDAEEARPRAA
ncbi:LysR substrate-binding domain-containing protein [Xanthobacter sp. KR7-225]|uniref:LysR substrate-binding domain-containing protein n=1 Tax=Xanthobacter sp. KR7-225 TaxID=3156613 RepID=UPI0032B4A245